MFLNLHKKTNEVLSKVMDDMYTSIIPKTDQHSYRISVEIQVITQEHVGCPNSADICCSHQYFGFKTLEKQDRY